MKKIKLALSVLCLTSFSWLFVSQAQAALITQGIFISNDSFGTVELGEITVEVDNAFVGTGIKDLFWDDEFSLVDFSILGSSALEFFGFEAQIDSDNLAAGIQYLFFDVSEVGFEDNWAYQVTIDTTAPEFTFYDIFDGSGSLMLFGPEVYFGEASLSDVPLPSTLSMMGLVLLSLVARRRALN